MKGCLPTFQVLQPAFELLEVFKHKQICFQITHALLKPDDVIREIAQDGPGSYFNEWRNSVGMPEAGLDVQNFLVQFAKLLPEDLV